MQQNLIFLTQHQKKQFSLYLKATLPSSKMTLFIFTPDMQFLCLSEALSCLTNATPEADPRDFLPAEHSTNQRPRGILKDILTLPVELMATEAELGLEKPALHILFLCQLQLAISWRRVMTPVAPPMYQCCWLY